MKKRTKGKNTKNQDNPGAPARQMRFNTHVQNNTYKILMRKSMNTLETLHSKDPKQ